MLFRPRSTCFERRRPWAVVHALTLGIVLLGANAPAQAAPDRATSAEDAELRDRSRGAFRKGVTELRAQDWSAARASFETAWSLFPHPSILLNLGLSRLRTGDPALAEQDLLRFLSEDPGATADELASAREALAEARALVGTLRIVVSPSSASILVDNRPVERLKPVDAGPLRDAVVAETRCKAGEHVIDVRAEGYQPGRLSLFVPAKSETEGQVSLTRISSSAKRPDVPVSDGRSIAGWGLLGFAGVAAGVGAFSGVRAKSLADAYVDRNSSRFQDADTRSQGITLRTAADVAFGVALVSGVAAVVLLLTGDSPRRATSPTAARLDGAPLQF